MASGLTNRDDDGPAEGVMPIATSMDGMRIWHPQPDFYPQMD